MRLRMLAALGLASALGGGCNTAVGNYFANRARDFGECWRAQAGIAVGFGAGVKALGLVDTGFGGGNWVSGLAVGVAYGEVFPQTEPETTPFVMQGSLLVFSATFRNNFRGIYPRRDPVTGAKEPQRADYGVVRASIVPFLLSWRSFDNAESKSVDAWIWSPPPAADDGALPPPRWWREARLHAFDVEAHACLGVLGVHVGFSPGEFVDFLLGWFGLDIAGDDVPLDVTPSARRASAQGPESP